MDLLRSCYRTRARLNPGCADETDITWSFCQTGAKVFPTWHSTGSLNWGARDEALVEIGELPDRPRPWSNGATFAASGQSFIGRIEQFQGVVPTACLPVANCCGPRDALPATLYFHVYSAEPGSEPLVGRRGVLNDSGLTEGLREWVNVPTEDFPSSVTPAFFRERFPQLPGWPCLEFVYLGFAGLNWDLAPNEQSTCQPLRLYFTLKGYFTILVSDTDLPIGLGFRELRLLNRPLLCHLAQLLVAVQAGDTFAMQAAADQFAGRPNRVIFLPFDPETAPNTAFVDYSYFAVVACAGTSTPNEWFDQITQASTGMVDQGSFSTLAIWKQGADYLISQLASFGVFQPKPILFCGYSMGGAVAEVANAIYSASQPSDTLKLVTFGQPKPGDLRLGRITRDLDALRVVNAGDIVPLIPPDIRTSLPLSLLVGPGPVWYWAQHVHEADYLKVLPDGTFSLTNQAENLWSNLVDVIVRWAAASPAPDPFQHFLTTYASRVCPANVK